MSSMPTIAMETILNTTTLHLMIKAVMRMGSIDRAKWQLVKESWVRGPSNNASILYLK